jgi:poly(A) polymerase
MISIALHNTDQRINMGKHVTPGFLFAVMLWFPLQQELDQGLQQNLPEVEALDVAIDVILKKQTKATAIPRRFTGVMREIWKLQPRLLKRKKRQVKRLLQHPRFRAAYDFLLIRAQIDNTLQPIADWWTHIQTLEPKAQNSLVSAL